MTVNGSVASGPPIRGTPDAIALGTSNNTISKSYNNITSKYKITNYKISKDIVKLFSPNIKIILCSYITRYNYYKKMASVNDNHSIITNNTILTNIIFSI